MQLANNLDTIAAIATPSGAGGIGVVRVSGSQARDVAKHLLGVCPENRFASYLSFLDVNGQVIDRGIALFFKSPHSYTGEDILELQGHGGIAVMQLLLARNSANATGSLATASSSQAASARILRHTAVRVKTRMMFIPLGFSVPQRGVARRQT